MKIEKKVNAAYKKKCRQRLKLMTVQHYGGKCACCEEGKLAFLTIDHTKGNGKLHRQKIRKEMYGATGEYAYRWLKRHAFPLGFQVLCFNCNVGRHINGGTCPHRDKQ